MMSRKQSVCHGGYAGNTPSESISVDGGTDDYGREDEQTIPHVIVCVTPRHRSW